LLLFVVSVLLANVACENAFALTIENKTDQTFIIYMEEGRVGDVALGGQILIRHIWHASNPYLLEAKNSLGETIYSRTFDFTELKKAKYKVIITNEGFIAEEPK